MIAYAAIDVRGGRVVQLVGGRPRHERVNLPDPPAVARRWVGAGFAALHVVDLDGALGRGDNLAAVAAVIDAVDVPVQVGGGVRDDQAADAWLERGAARVVVGTRAIEDPAWLARLARRHPGRIVLAADVRGSEIVTRGWTERTGVNAGEFLRDLASLPLAAALVTDVDREGRMAGVDAGRFADLAAASPHPVIASGGIAGVEDLRALARRGAAGAVLGMALYTGAVDARAIAAEFAR